MNLAEGPFMLRLGFNFVCVVVFFGNDSFTDVNKIISLTHR